MDNKETLRMKALEKLGKPSITKIDEKTAMMAINSDWNLKIDVSFPPELWEVSSKKLKKTFDWTKDQEVPVFVRGVIEELRDIYNDSCISLSLEGGDEVTEELSITKEVVEATEPELTTEEKLEELDKIMNGEVEAPKKEIIKRQILNSQKMNKSVPAVIPDRTRTMQISELTTQDIISYLCPKASEKEAMIFLKLCQARGINPFLKEAYLIKYKDSDPASMVVSKDYFALKAEKHPMYDGSEDGIIIQKGDNIEKRVGTFKLPDEKLVGGWCKVFRKDRSRPTTVSVALHEYQQRKFDGSLTKFWEKMEATMICKVAFSQCHRKAFPGDFGGLYDAAEIDVDGQVIDAVYEYTD